MFKVTIEGTPKSAKRPNYVPQFGRVITPKDYREYKDWLIGEFNKYANDPELIEVLTKQKYGLSVKLIYRFDRGASYQPFHRNRPDVDNLYKATIDALFQSDVNRIADGFVVDENGQPVDDGRGNKIVHYKQRIDDSQIVHNETWKLNIDPTKEKPSQTIIIRKIEEVEL